MTPMQQGAAGLAGISIASLFAFARREARRSRIEEMRARTMMQEKNVRVHQEEASRRANLERMRAMTSSSLGMQLGSVGLSPGMYGGPNAALMQAAAARSGSSPARTGLMLPPEIEAGKLL